MVNHFSACSLPSPILASTASEGCECIYDSARSSGVSVFLAGGYVEALEVTKEAPGQGAFRPQSISEETYDDVECPGRKE